MWDLATIKRMNSVAVLDEDRLRTYDEVVDVLREIVAEHPDGYTYEAPQYVNEYGTLNTVSGCTYTTKSGKPSCIVGHVISRMTPKLLPGLHRYEWEDHGYSDPCTASLGGLVEECVTEVPLRERYTQGALDLLQIVQMRQDRGAEWHEAVELTIRGGSIT